MRLLVAIFVGLSLLSGCADGPAVPSSSAGTGEQAGQESIRLAGTSARSVTLPRYDHVVVVVFENKGIARTKAHAPYLMGLAKNGALMTQSYAVTHPSQPNYVALYSGKTRGITDNTCPQTTGAPHLGGQLLNRGLTFTGYSEGLPEAGSMVCSDGRYRRRHAPWVSFSTFPQERHLPFSRFPTDFTTLPTVSFVIPDMCHDMHNCSVARGDTWLKNRLGPYARWARTHNSLLLVTFDEDDHTESNRVLTLLYGAHIRPGRYGQHIDHYRVLRTIEAFYGLDGLGNAADRKPIRRIWR